MFDKDFELEMENNFPINESNNFPKFILGDTFENEEILFVTHTEYPQFILNIETQEIKFLCKINNILNPTFRSGVFLLYKVYWSNG